MRGTLNMRACVRACAQLGGGWLLQNQAQLGAERGGIQPWDRGILLVGHAGILTDHGRLSSVQYRPGVGYADSDKFSTPFHHHHHHHHHHLIL